MPIKPNDEAEVSAEKMLHSSDTDTQQINALSNNQTQKSQSGNKNHSYILQLQENIKFPKAQLPDLSGLRLLSDNYKTLQAKLVESIKPYVDIQEKINNALNNLYQPLRHMNEIMRSFSDVFHASLFKINRALRVINALASNQYVVWYNVSIDDYEVALDSEYLDNYMLNHFSRNNSQQLFELIQGCRVYLQARPGYTLFDQSVISMTRGEYHAAIIGFTSALDGLLTFCSGSESTSVKQRLALLNSKLLEQNDDSMNTDGINEYWLYSTLFPVIESFAAHTSFKESEPTLLNRHWLMHGRTTRDYLLIDCIKVLSMIYGMILIGKLIKND